MCTDRDEEEDGGGGCTLVVVVVRDVWWDLKRDGDEIFFE